LLKGGKHQVIEQVEILHAKKYSGFEVSIAPQMALQAAAGCRHMPIAGGLSRRIGYARIRRKRVPSAQKAFIAWLKELSRSV
jgi:hypothetical protein